MSNFVFIRQSDLLYIDGLFRSYRKNVNNITWMFCFDGYCS